MTNRQVGNRGQPAASGGAKTAWRIRILGLQRPGRRPEHHERELEIQAETQSAAASQGVARVLEDAHAAGDPLEPGTRFQTTVGGIGGGRESRMVVTYQPGEKNTTAAETTAAETHDLATTHGLADYYVRVNSQQAKGGPRVPLAWEIDQRARGPEQAGQNAVLALRAQMPGLIDKNAAEMTYLVETIRRGNTHQPFEGWELEVTVDADRRVVRQTGGGKGRRVH